MDKFVIKPGDALHGSVVVSGAKNAVLPILAACLLTEESCEIQNVPALTDVEEMITLLEGFGAAVSFDRTGEVMNIQAGQLNSMQADVEAAGKMRASFLTAGPLLARYRQVRIPLPGGCQIGTRPVDLHIKGFLLLGASQKQEYGMVELWSKSELRGKNVYLDFPSVGATENIMMAATLARGTTVIENAAAEPEICDLADLFRNLDQELQ